MENIRKIKTQKLNIWSLSSWGKYLVESYLQMIAFTVWFFKGGWKDSIKWFTHDLFTGWGKYERYYAISLVLFQIIFFIIYPESVAGFITGLFGTICVLLVAKGKLSNYFFGFIQTGVAMVLGFQAGLIGETGENIFYFLTQLFGIKSWKDNVEEETVVKRKLTLVQWVIMLTVIAIPTLILGFLFQTFNGTQPYIDSFTLIVAIVAQMLMVVRFREQWLLWLLLNVVSLYQWYILDNKSLVAMYIAFTINTIYGYVNWSKQIKEHEKLEKEKSVLGQNEETN